MSKQHPYPEHIVEAVKMQLSKGYGDLYVCTRDDSAWSYGTMSLDDFHRLDSDEDVLDDLTNDMLGMLWDASRVDNLDQLTHLPGDAVIRGQDYWLGYTPDAEFQLSNDDLPAHILHWGDSDE